LDAAKIKKKYNMNRGKAMKVNAGIFAGVIF